MNTRKTTRNNSENVRPPRQESRREANPQRDRQTNPINPIERENIATEISRSIHESLPAIIAQVQAAMNHSSVHGATAGENQPTNGQTQGCDYKAFKTTSPSTFEGKGGPIAAMNWLDDMESCFETCQCAAEQRVRFASTKLKLNALHWWKTIQATRGITGATLMPWNEFKRLVNQRYCPNTRVKIMEEEFIRLEQGGKSVEEYVEIFIEKSRFASDMITTEGRKVDRFMHGLRKDLRQLVNMSKPQSFQEAVDLAILAEKDSYMPNDYQPNGKRKFEDKNFGRTFKKTRGNDARTTFCPKCNKNHSGECMMGNKVCYKCGQSGHMANNCPER